jgi:Fe-S-cluster containining protein
VSDLASRVSNKELLWLGCRHKTCCHNTRVVISGMDIWRITQTLEVQPWDYTRYADAIEGAIDAFRLRPDGPSYQVVLAKRGEVDRAGAPCIFLWNLADGHAQCGLGALRPLVCRVYPAVLVDGML